ncbi:alpha/beta fold hydrolase [Candidatus Solirubrobacter pratensis]|uniref:alpha/beta fold hydrolase n=1 Tax=Candidatus Solirubrobacter pratensis TaxID=1298857 RepID=UPI00040F5376|nr:alpha/beta fold hydrolase [Candidatus Solirubrobacter pratensis]
MVSATARRAALPALLALVFLLAVPNAARALTWKACPDFDGVRCSSVSVPLDRTGADPGQIALRVARVGKTSGRTLMYLSGGPGGAGVSEMLGVIPIVEPLARRYRVIGFDQRGTGRSGLLRCPALEHDPHLRSTTAAARCAASLGAARRHYTTPDSVQDMEAIRQALGVEKLTLFGISYGTELALEYARTFPAHVDRLILDSVVDPDDADPFGTAGFRAMAPTLAALCPSKCRGISSDPAGDLAKLVAKVRARPMRGRAYDSRGRPHTIRIGPTALLDLMFQADYDPALRAALPATVTSALAGDGAPLARLLRESARLDDLGPPSEFSSARYATICEETPLPWDPGTPVEQRAAVTQQRIAVAGPDAFRPFDPQSVVEDEIDLCLRWPDVPRPPSPAPKPPYPAVPTLILQGGEDLRTPPEVSARVAAEIPGAKRVVVPGVGHAITGADPSGCGQRALLRFVAGRSFPATCRRVPTGVPGVLYGPRRFESLRGFPGVPRKVGRTLRALEATFDDLRVVTSAAVLTSAGGGLRGGTWTAHGGRLTVDRYTVVGGVTVTGGGTSRLTLRIAGSKAAHGTVTLRSGGRLAGTLGGHRIAVRLSTSASSAKRRARIAQLAR